VLQLVNFLARQRRGGSKQDVGAHVRRNETGNNTTKVLREHRAHRKEIIANAAAAKKKRFDPGNTERGGKSRSIGTYEEIVKNRHKDAIVQPRGRDYPKGPATQTIATPFGTLAPVAMSTPDTVGKHIVHSYH